jgi:hypothetical protein
MGIINVTSEPSGNVYQRLLAYLAQNSASFSLVRHDQLDFNLSADKLDEELRSFRIRQNRTNKCPGTELMGHFATVTFYRVTNDSIAILLRTGALYKWLSPNYPEDLSFYRVDGSCLFASVSHEKDALFEGQLTVDEIRADVPGLKVKKHKD